MTDKPLSNLTLVTADTGDETYIVRDGNSRRIALSDMFRPASISPTYPGLNLNSGAVINWASGDVTLTHAANTLTFAGASSGYLFDAIVAPSSNDGSVLGSAARAWSDLFLADGAVVNWGAGGATATHAAASDSLTLALDAANLLAATTLTLAVDGTSLVALAGTALSPATNDVAALGTTSLMWSDLFLADGAVINWGAGGVTATHAAAVDSLTLALDAANLLASTTLTLAVDGTSLVALAGTALSPATSDVAALGTTSLGWADLFLADGGVVNWGNGGVTITHTAASDSLTLALDAGNALASTLFTIALDGANELVLSAAALYPAGDDGLALGITNTNQWADLFLASGGVVNWSNGDVTITHSANALAFAGVTSGYSFDDTLTVTDATNPLRLVNNTDGASVQVVRLEGDRATMADNDEAYASLMLSNDGGTQTEFARLTWVATDVNAATSVDGALSVSVAIAGTLAAKLRLEDSVLSPSASDGTALGSTSLMWADLFLASGSVINWNNGDLTLTHASNLLTLAGGDLSLGTTAVFTTGSIELGAASDTTLSRSAAGVLAVEGINALLANKNDTIVAGFYVTSFSAGTKSSGTFTPDAANGNKQYATNGGAHTLAPPTSASNIELEYTNNVSAGTITTSGFTIAKGDAFTTTNGHKFLCYISKTQTYSLLNVVALQ